MENWVVIAWGRWEWGIPPTNQPTRGSFLLPGVSCISLMEESISSGEFARQTLDIDGGCEYL